MGQVPMSVKSLTSIVMICSPHGLKLCLEGRRMHCKHHIHTNRRLRTRELGQGTQGWMTKLLACRTWPRSTSINGLTAMAMQSPAGMAIESRLLSCRSTSLTDIIKYTTRFLASRSRTASHCCLVFPVPSAFPISIRASAVHHVTRGRRALSVYTMVRSCPCRHGLRASPRRVTA